MKRRHFLPALAAGLASGKTWRVAIAGATGRGNFGHDWEAAWDGVPGVDVVAVSDSDPKGRAAAAARSHARKTYSDYREMIAKEKPEIVTICPRWTDQRIPMVTAAAEAGAHMIVEKPLAADVADARRIVDLTEKRGLKVQVGHTARVLAVTRIVRDMLQRGELGQLMEIRARGKEDKRAGGEDMMVLGTHCFDLMRYFAGDPQWVFASIQEKSRRVDRTMMRKPTEPIGEVAGDDISATFRFRNGIPGYFASKASDVPKNDRFGVCLYCSKGMVYLPLTDVPSAAPYVLRSPNWAGAKWERVEYPSNAHPTTREDTNRLMAADLIAAIEQNRAPVCSSRDALWTIRMVAAIYESHFKNAPVSF